MPVSGLRTNSSFIDAQSVTTDAGMNGLSPHHSMKPSLFLLSKPCSFRDAQRQFIGWAHSPESYTSYHQQHSLQLQLQRHYYHLHQRHQQLARSSSFLSPAALARRFHSLGFTNFDVVGQLEPLFQFTHPPPSWLASAGPANSSRSSQASSGFDYEECVRQLDIAMTLTGRMYSTSFSSWVKHQQNSAFTLDRLIDIALSSDSIDLHRIVAGLVWLTESYSEVTMAECCQTLIAKWIATGQERKLLPLAMHLMHYWHSQHIAGDPKASSSATSDDMTSIQAALDDVSLLAIQLEQRESTAARHPAPSPTPTPTSASSAPDTSPAEPPLSPDDTDDMDENIGDPSAAPPSGPGSTPLSSRIISIRSRRQRHQHLQRQQRDLHERLQAEAKPTPRKQQLACFLGLVLSALSPQQMDSAVFAATDSWSASNVTSFLRHVDSTFSNVCALGEKFQDEQRQCSGAERRARMDNPFVSTLRKESLFRASPLGHSSVFAPTLAVDIPFTALKRGFADRLKLSCQSFTLKLRKLIQNAHLRALESMKLLYETRIAVAELKIEMARFNLVMAKYKAASAATEPLEALEAPVSATACSGSAPSAVPCGSEASEATNGDDNSSSSSNFNDDEDGGGSDSSL